ncbi:chromosomal replication initiator protein DnaA [Palleronia sediminis]|uniref:Chromosomal replication initiator protein DnaA n=1 Tax=Palleronia sediminis TaxID=2547833 RepID=A0A4V6PP85_9RHOB|nr:chromosomal replication initiator protein DnaA [Palleronia sediminis]TDL81539.1 chromosomal replication initiator protein DnaA [Palleronia sediminis]
MGSDVWDAVQAKLESAIGGSHYTAWIAPLRFLGLDDGVLTLSVPTSFAGSWVQRHYGDIILRVLSDTAPEVRRLSFAAEKTAALRDPRERAAANGPADSLAMPSGRRPAPRAPMQEEGVKLDPTFTFANFVVGKTNEIAHAAARRIADGGELLFNPLFFYSDVGLGKTHLMHAIGWALRERDPDTRVLYMTAEHFMWRFIQSLQSRTTMDFKQMFRSVDVLMVDEIQFIAGKNNTQEEFFHTFNVLVDQGKQIVLSGDKAPGDITGLEQRIVSRMHSGLVCNIHPTSYELRVGILQRKFAEKRRQFPGVEIGDDILDFLATRVTGNVRELDGALNRLLVEGSLIGDLSLGVAEDILSDLVRVSDWRPSVEHIQRVVAEHYNLRMSDFLSTNRARIYARPRQVAMLLARELTDRSLKEIAFRFKKRDHTTVKHAISQISSLEQSDAQVREDLALLRRALKLRSAA